jgi:hypothetical protein
MPPLWPVGPAVAEGAASLLSKVGLPIRRAPLDFQSRPDIGIVGRNLSGVRRYLERYEPEIPRLLDSAYEANMRAVEGVETQLNTLAKSTGLGPGNPALEQAILAAEGQFPVASLNPAQRRVHDWWDSFRRESGLLMGLGPDGRTERYFTHLVEPMNRPQMEAVLAGTAGRETLSAADQFRIRAIHAISTREGVPLAQALDVMGGTPQYMRDLTDNGTIPRHVFNAFEQMRKGFPVYSKDFYDVARTYARAVYRQHHLEPALRQVSVLAEHLPPNLKAELKSRIEHGMLRKPTQMDKLLQATWAPFETWARTLTGGRVNPGPNGIERAFRSTYYTIAFWDIGFNPSPIKKHFVADMMSIWAEIGNPWTERGFFHTLSPDATSRALRQMAREIGNVRERIPDVELFSDFLPASQRGVKGALRGLNEWAFKAYQKVDLGNQYTAWIGGYQKALAKGETLAPVRDLLARGMTPEQAAIEYANRLTRYTVPRQTPLDMPGLLRSTPMKLAFQFSSKKMQRAELVWDQMKRFTGGDWSPFTRTLLGTAFLTGLPLDEMFAKHTGLDPERIPIYDVLGKVGFGLRKVLHGFFPHLGPVFQLGADIARVGHDPSRLFDQVFNKVSPVAFSGRDIYDTGPVSLPLGLRSTIRLGQELGEGTRRTRYGEQVVPSTPPNAIAHWLGFDEPTAVKTTQAFAEALHSYHEELGDASRAVSVLYHNTVTTSRNWPAFMAGLVKVQKQFPDVEVTDSLINRAITRVEQPRAERLTGRAPQGFLARHPDLIPSGR